MIVPTCPPLIVVYITCVFLCLGPVSLVFHVRQPDYQHTDPGQVSILLLTDCTFVMMVTKCLKKKLLI